LFKGTYIGQNPTVDRGKFLLLTLSFGDINADDETADSFHNYINSITSDFSKRYYQSGYLE
jgi:hypothetical protein